MPIDAAVLARLEEDHPTEQIAWAIYLCHNPDIYPGPLDRIRALSVPGVPSISTITELRQQERAMVAAVRRVARYANFALDVWERRKR